MTLSYYGVCRASSSQRQPVLSQKHQASQTAPTIHCQARQSCLLDVEVLNHCPLSRSKTNTHLEINFTVRDSCPVQSQAQETPDRKLGLGIGGGGYTSSWVTSCLFCASIYNTCVHLLGYPPPGPPSLGKSSGASLALCPLVKMQTLGQPFMFIY